jgi:hypothetical protein
MSVYQPAPNFSQRFHLVQSSFLQHAGLPFAEVLPEERIQQAFEDEGVAFAQGEQDVYSPAITLWAFLSQVLFKGEQRSCLAAVTRVVVLWVALGKEPCSDNTGAYCRARAKLPLVVLQRLTLAVADGCEQKMPTHWLWKGRHVHLVDGTTVSMPDTAKNQAAYPQPTTQEPSLGFPQARMVVLMSLASARSPCRGTGRHSQPLRAYHESRGMLPGTRSRWRMYVSWSATFRIFVESVFLRISFRMRQNLAHSKGYSY